MFKEWGWGGQPEEGRGGAEALSSEGKGQADRSRAVPTKLKCEPHLLS